MDIITELLNLEDADITVSDIRIERTKKILTLDTALYAHYCPCCGFRMYSRGVRKRKIIHPILQDGYELILILRQRRWKCSNPDCLYTANEAFRFVDSRRRTTNASDILIVRAFRDLLCSVKIKIPEIGNRIPQKQKGNSPKSERDIL